MRFASFINEKLTPNGSLTVFDIDETLFTTTAEIGVVKDGKLIKKLSNSEFNTYKLQPGEKFDFEEFKDAQKFHDESKPIVKMLDKAKAILANSSKNPQSKVIIITAREDFDNKDIFLNTFRKHGFDIDNVHVHRAGNIKDKVVPAYKKVIIIKKYLDQHKYGRVRLFDDSMKNLQEFLKMKQEYPEIQFDAYLADHNGSIKTIKE